MMPFEQFPQENKHLIRHVLTDIDDTLTGGGRLPAVVFTAIDYCEDVPRLSESEVARIVSIFIARGATVKVSSIHVNGWYGDYDKLAMTLRMFTEIFDTDLAAIRDKVIFVGDLANDAPMFGYFQNSVGVANVLALADKDGPPAHLATAAGGYGFVELVDQLLSSSAG